MIGCEHGAKKTLDQNYLREAKAHAEIRPLSMVTHIDEGPNGGWRVHYLDVGAGHRRRRRQIDGKIVILAAGSIGSTEILLRSRDGFRTLKNLPRALGKGWSPNGDFLTLARYRNGRPLQPTKGPTIGGVIDFLDGVDLPDDNAIGVDGRIYVEDGGLPNVGAHLLKSWKDAGGPEGMGVSESQLPHRFQRYGRLVRPVDRRRRRRVLVAEPPRVLAREDTVELESATLGLRFGHVQGLPCRDDACDGR